MKVLGEGESNGAISILHALGLGRGCSIGIQLTTKVQIVEDAVEIEDDRNGLLAAVEKCWRDRGLPTPRPIRMEGGQLNPYRPRAQVELSIVLCSSQSPQFMCLDRSF